MPRSNIKKSRLPLPPEKRTEKYWQELNTIIDPELNLGIVDLGLIYNVKIDKKGDCTISMTLTSPACPVGPQLIQQVETRMLMYPGVKKVYVEIVWDPPWTQERINEELRDLIFGF